MGRQNHYTTGLAMQFLQPKGLPYPRGYSNGVVAEGKVICVAGQVGWNARGEFETDDFAGQVRQALRNIVTVLAAAGAAPNRLTRLTWYVTDKREYLEALKDVGRAYREVIGDHYPAMTLVQVAGLLDDRAKVEIEATAVIPPAP
jgi:enamine deaminase RidA (YjgF/YER057c/UK114 family)